MNDPSARMRQQQERERQLVKLKQYRALWSESERVLNVLRSESGVPMKLATNEEITQWAEAN